MNNKDLIRQYVDTGLKIPEYQMNRLSGNLLQSYLRKRLIANNNEFKLEDYEVARLPDEQRNKYVKDKYDFVDNIINNKTYLSVTNFNAATDEQKLRYIKYKLEHNNNLYYYEFNYLNPEQKHNYIEHMINNQNSLTSNEYIIATNEQKLKYLLWFARTGNSLNKKELEITPQEILNQYFEAKIENHEGIYDAEYEYYTKGK